MTDRFNGVFVAFERDIREDDAEATIAAIRQIKGVAGVTPNVADIRDHVAQQRARNDLLGKLYALLDSLR